MIGIKKQQYNAFRQPGLRTFRCQGKFLTCQISDFTPCAHPQNNILHVKYAQKSGD